MPKPRTAIRLMWRYHDDTVVGWPTSTDETTGVLVVPYNPPARLAMIRRTVKTLWPRAKGKARERREAEVMVILGTALCPTRQKAVKGGR